MINDAPSWKSFNPYSADFFTLFILTSFCLGISRNGSIYLFDLFLFFQTRGKIQNVPFMGR